MQATHHFGSALRTQGFVLGGRMSLQTATGVVGSDCTLNISMGVEMVWNSLRTGKGPLPGFGVEVLAGEYGRK